VADLALCTCANEQDILMIKVSRILIFFMFNDFLFFIDTKLTRKFNAGYI